MKSNDKVIAALLREASELAPEATVIVLVAGCAGDEGRITVDMLNANHEVTADAIAVLAEWLSSDVEEAQEDAT